MGNNKMSDEVKDFLNALKFMQSKEGKEQSKIMDEETVMLYNIWHKIISAECGKEYSKTKIREIRKRILEESKEQIEQLESKKIIGYDNSLAVINSVEEMMINNIKNTILYINSIDEQELIDIILESVFTSKENMEILLQQKSQMEQEKFEELSYRGQKCVEGDTINNDLIKKIYNEIKGRGLNSISKRVETTFNTNKQYINLNKAKINAGNIIIYQIYKIYEEKIENIKKEIAEELQKLSKSKYKDYKNPENINLIIIREKLKKEQQEMEKGIRKIFNGIKKIYTKNTQQNLSEILSTVEGTIKHQKTKDEYEKRLQNFDLDKDMEEIYNKTNVAKKINDLKNNILSGTGIIINNITDDIISLYIEELRKELDIQIALLNAQITETCTKDEQDKVEEFANIIGMSIENTLKFLRNEKSIYACLFTYLFGTEIQEKLDNNTAPKFLIELDPKWKFKDKNIDEIIEKAYLPKKITRPIKEKNKQLPDNKQLQKRLTHRK